MLPISIHHSIINTYLGEKPSNRDTSRSIQAKQKPRPWKPFLANHMKSTMPFISQFLFLLSSLTIFSSVVPVLDVECSVFGSLISFLGAFEIECLYAMVIEYHYVSCRRRFSSALGLERLSCLLGMVLIVDS